MSTIQNNDFGFSEKERLNNWSAQYAKNLFERAENQLETAEQKLDETISETEAELKKNISGIEAQLSEHTEKAILDHPDQSVNGRKIADGAIAAKHISDYAVEGRALAGGAVDERVLASGCVGEKHLAEEILKKHQEWDENRKAIGDVESLVTQSKEVVSAINELSDNAASGTGMYAAIGNANDLTTETKYIVPAINELKGMMEHDKLWQQLPQYTYLVNKNSGQVLGLRNGSGGDNTVVVTYHKTGAYDQVWCIMPAEDGSVKLLNRYCNKVMCVRYGDTAENAAIAIFADTGTPDQKWRLEPVARDGKIYYKIVNENSGMILAIRYAATAELSTAVQFPFTGTDDQLWSLESYNPSVLPDGSIPDRYCRIINKNSGKVLSIRGVSVVNDANLIQWDWENTPNQKWMVFRHDDGTVAFMNQNSRKSLAVRGISLDDGAQIIQWQSLNETNQCWRLEPVEADGGDTYYKIVSANSGKLMSVAGARTDNDADIIQWTDEGTDGQLWKLEDVPAEIEDAGTTENYSLKRLLRLDTATPEILNENFDMLDSLIKKAEDEGAETDFSAVQEYVDANFVRTDQLLEEIKKIDGEKSGIDADFINGKSQYDFVQAEYGTYTKFSEVPNCSRMFTIETDEITGDTRLFGVIQLFYPSSTYAYLAIDYQTAELYVACGWQNWNSVNMDSLSDHGVYIGGYWGDGQESQFIELDFTPRAVEIYTESGRQNFMNEGSEYFYGGFADNRWGCKTDSFQIIQVETGGFRVYCTEERNIYTNQDGIAYRYKAYR